MDDDGRGISSPWDVSCNISKLGLAIHLGMTAFTFRLLGLSIPMLLRVTNRVGGREWLTSQATSLIRLLLQDATAY